MAKTQYEIQVQFENGEIGVISGESEIEMTRLRSDVHPLWRPCTVIGAKFSNENGTTIWPYKGESASFDFRRIDA